MAEIGMKSGKVSAGVYREGPYRIQKDKDGKGWSLYLGRSLEGRFHSLSDARYWARRSRP